MMRNIRHVTRRVHKGPLNSNSLFIYLKYSGLCVNTTIQSSEGFLRTADHATQKKKCESVCKGTIRGGAKEREEESACVARILELVIIVIVMKEGRMRQNIIKSCKLVFEKRWEC